ncbi:MULTISPECIES: YeiH family protein [unclassified Sedimentibacter]|uniref:YeiH family protein n=1 Tax=unclassified Sedimentibacter TaxID=2649220 RepID=UPI0027E00310|nr:YeiH family protein [Sedimentibacter sp. MB35-C1]WMJ77962.1 YeiH family protein [Sedimentibacter sp. MB35-C1]
MKKIIDNVPGVIVAFAIALPAWKLGKMFPVVGGPVLGILFGMILAFFKRPAVLEKGIKYTSKKMLQYSIILLGFNMNLFNVFSVGKQTLSLMAFTLTAAFLTAYIAGKSLSVQKNTNILIGVGTAICGGSAIAATAPVIRARDEEVAVSISTIFLFNVIAAFLFPFLGHILHMSDYSFGLWAGTAINDTSSVVAAGYTFSDAAGNLAVIVKLTRTLMIIPVTLVLAFTTSRGQAKSNYQFSKIFPWFVVGFLVASILCTFTPIPGEISDLLVKTGKYVIIMAMSAIGLNTNLIKLVKNGWKPIFLGLCCWIALSVTSIAVQYLILNV